MDNPTLKTLNNLRSIHWDFNGKKVPDSDMRKIIAQGMRAAHSTNLGDYSVIVVDEADIIKKLVGNSAPARCCIFCVDKTRTIAAAKLLKRDDYAPDESWYALFAELYDVYAMAQTSVIAAKSMGIDSLITNGVFRVDIDRIKELLNLPEKNCFPVIAVLFGYSDKPENITTGRISVDHVLHFNSYKPANENGVRKFIDEMDKIYPEYINEKYKHTMNWYFDKWLDFSKGEPKQKDIRLRNALEKSGYIF